MSQAIDILNELEQVFDEKKAKVLTSVMLKREELSHTTLVTKDDFYHGLSDLKAEIKAELQKEAGELRKEAGELRKEMYQGFLDMQKSITDVQKSITRMTIYFISAIGVIATIFKLLDIFVKS